MDVSTDGRGSCAVMVLTVYKLNKNKGLDIVADDSSIANTFSVYFALVAVPSNNQNPDRSDYAHENSLADIRQLPVLTKLRSFIFAVNLFLASAFMLTKDQAPFSMHTPQKPF